MMPAWYKTHQPAAADNPSSSEHPTSPPPEAENSPLLVTSSPPPADSRPGATLVLNWLFIQQQQHQLVDGSHNGVKVPRGIGNLSSMHTLDVVNINAAARAFWRSSRTLPNCTSLECRASTRTKQRRQVLFSHRLTSQPCVQSLSLHVQGQLNEANCLGGISEETIKSMRLGSLKLYLDDCRLPVWIKNLWNLRKLRLHKTKLAQEEIFLLPNLHRGNLATSFSVRAPRWYAPMQFSVRAAHLEISCSSRLQAKITFAHGMHHIITVLKIRCPRVSLLQIHGLRPAASRWSEGSLAQRAL
ncbi:hypothetical protein SEVIR_8G194950v4 [Setaria viridis]